MVNSWQLLCGLSLIITLLISCDKDDKYYVSPESYLKIEDTIYILSSGTIENYGKMENHSMDFGGYNLDLTLFFSGYTIYTTSGGDRFVSGSGQSIYFEMFSYKRDDLDCYEYTKATCYPYPVTTYDFGRFSMTYSGENEDDYSVEIAFGTVSIDKIEDKYIITIDCYSEKNEHITGFFEGPLMYFDYAADSESVNMLSTEPLFVLPLSQRNDLAKNNM